MRRRSCGLVCHRPSHEVALAACTQGRAIAGCGYIGRQDLSILEHARLAHGAAPNRPVIEPATDREDVENVAPGGISTAFLAIGAPPTALPDLPEHYNEDYVWLHAMQRAGWPLRRVATSLIHAPPGDVTVTTNGLSFQIHGEIVWLAVLERDRFPAYSRQGIAAAVEEIADDIRNALVDPAIVDRSDISGVLREVLDHYSTIRGQFATGELGSHAERLLRDVLLGLRLRP